MKRLLIALALLIPTLVEASPILRVDIDLTWDAHLLPEPIHFYGTALWKADTGYLESQWHFPDLSLLNGAPSHWMDIFEPTIPHRVFVDDGNPHIVGLAPQYYHTITVLFEGGPQPGSYDIGAARFAAIDQQGPGIAPVVIIWYADAGAITVSTVPEPGTLVLLLIAGAGALGVGWTRRG